MLDFFIVDFHQQFFCCLYFYFLFSLADFLTGVSRQSQAKLCIFPVLEVGLGSSVHKWPSASETAVLSGIMERKSVMVLLSPKVNSNEILQAEIK